MSTWLWFILGLPAGLLLGWFIGWFGVPVRRRAPKRSRENRAMARVAAPTAATAPTPAGAAAPEREAPERWARPGPTPAPAAPVESPHGVPPQSAGVPADRAARESIAAASAQTDTPGEQMRQAGPHADPGALLEIATPVDDGNPGEPGAPGVQDAAPPATAAAPASSAHDGDSDSAQPASQEARLTPGEVAALLGEPGTTDIEQIEGIGPIYARKLRDAGVTSVSALFAAASTDGARRKLAEELRISRKLLLRWVNHADLMRVPGVDTQLAELLEAAGVDSPTELQHRVPAHLAARMAEVDREKHIAPEVPDETTVAAWIEAAKQLPKIVTH